MTDKQKPTKKKKSLPATKSISLGGFFDRFHAVIFVVVVFGGLAVAVFALSSLLSETYTPDPLSTQPSTEASFDSGVIEKVEQLQPISNSPHSPDMPPGRTHPF